MEVKSKEYKKKKTATDRIRRWPKMIEDAQRTRAGPE